ncbi:MAG: hypothetical protein WDZ41_04905 [Candidatus Babeliales bacterium]
MNSREALEYFKNLKISKNELMDRIQSEKLELIIDAPVVIYSKDLINLLNTYKKKIFLKIN